MAGDGAQVRASYASANSAAWAGVVILPDARGLHSYYQLLAEEFASCGLSAVAIDYYARVLGPTDSLRPDDFPWQDHLPRVEMTHVDLDIEAATVYLRETRSGALPIFVVGFCFGGSQAWRAAASSLELSGCVGFYGRPERVGVAADHVYRPVLMLIAGADDQTPVDEQLALARRMCSAGAEVDIEVFHGAPHSFFDGAAGDWEAECQVAWQAVLNFMERHSRKGP